MNVKFCNWSHRHFLSLFSPTGIRNRKSLCHDLRVLVGGGTSKVASQSKAGGSKTLPTQEKRVTRFNTGSAGSSGMKL